MDAPNKQQHFWRQQAWLFTLLVSGLAIYFVLSWYLYAVGRISDPNNVALLHQAGLRLFLPYLGLAVGGVFAAKRFHRIHVEASVFVIAISILVLWDLLAVGNLLLVLGQGAENPWTVEDVLHFSDDTMQGLSVLPAAAVGYYFGAQTEERSSATQRNGAQAEGKPAAA